MRAPTLYFNSNTSQNTRDLAALVESTAKNDR